MLAALPRHSGQGHDFEPIEVQAAVVGISHGKAVLTCLEFKDQRFAVVGDPDFPPLVCVCAPAAGAGEEEWGVFLVERGAVHGDVAGDAVSEGVAGADQRA